MEFPNFVHQFICFSLLFTHFLQTEVDSLNRFWKHSVGGFFRQIVLQMNFLYFQIFIYAYQYNHIWSDFRNNFHQNSSLRNFIMTTSYLTNLNTLSSVYIISMLIEDNPDHYVSLFFLLRCSTLNIIILILNGQSTSIVIVKLS